MMVPSRQLKKTVRARTVKTMRKRGHDQSWILDTMFELMALKKRALKQNKSAGVKFFGNQLR